MRIASSIAGVLAAFVVAVGASSGASGYGSAEGTGGGGRSSVAASGGMYGELTGDATRTADPPAARPESRASAPGAAAVRGYAAGDTRCSMYANPAGMGSYCSSGDGTYRPLVERFPEMRFENCRYDDPPAGVAVPRNPDPRTQRWQLRTCLTGIDWFTYDGGDDRRFAIELVLVDKDTDTGYHETALSEFLWSSVQTTYPIPMLQVEPRHVPVVGQEAYFTFDWLDGETREPVSEGPYSGVHGGGPYVEQTNRGLLMRARAGAITVDPQIEGTRPFRCGVSELGYDDEASPGPRDQRSDCRYVFERSSAAAEELSTAESGEPDAYRLKFDIRWDVDYGRRGHGFSPFGSYHMVVFQDLPVMESQAVNIPSYDGAVGR